MRFRLSVVARLGHLYSGHQLLFLLIHMNARFALSNLLTGISFLFLFSFIAEVMGTKTAAALFGLTVIISSVLSQVSALMHVAWEWVMLQRRLMNS